MSPYFQIPGTRCRRVMPPTDEGLPKARRRASAESPSRIGPNSPDRRNVRIETPASLVSMGSWRNLRANHFVSLATPAVVCASTSPINPRTHAFNRRRVLPAFLKTTNPQPPREIRHGNTRVKNAVAARRYACRCFAAHHQRCVGQRVRTPIASRMPAIRRTILHFRDDIKHRGRHPVAHGKSGPSVFVIKLQKIRRATENLD